MHSLGNARVSTPPHSPTPLTSQLRSLLSIRYEHFGRNMAQSDHASGRRAGISVATVARLAFVTDAAVARYERDGLCFERGRSKPCEEAIARLDKVYLWLSAMPG